MPADLQQKQAESSVERDENGRFVKGQSGNPAGRMPGTRNRATTLAEQLFDGRAAALANKAVEMALAGDAAALRLCLGRIIAPRRHRPNGFALPPLTSAADFAPAMAAIAAAVGDGTLSPGEDWEAIRAALAATRIDPASLSCLGAFADAEARLSELGDSPHLQAADAAFAAAEPALFGRRETLRRRRRGWCRDSVASRRPIAVPRCSTGTPCRSRWPVAPRRKTPSFRGAACRGEPGIHEHKPWDMDSGFGPAGRPGMTMFGIKARRGQDCVASARLLGIAPH